MRLSSVGQIVLSAFVPPSLLAPAYEQALTDRYLWHEFGDVNLIL